MISIGFASLLLLVNIGITLGVDCYPTEVGSGTCLDHVGLTLPAALGGGTSISSTKRTCDANGGQVTREYDTVDCSGDVSTDGETVVAKGDLGALCGECEEYALLEGNFYATDACTGTAIGTFSTVNGFVDTNGCDGHGTQSVCAGTNGVEVTQYANDDCSGEVNSTVTYTVGSCLEYNFGIGMKLNRVVCSKAPQMVLNWSFMVVAMAVLFLK
eukprot:77078_1